MSHFWPKKSCKHAWCPKWTVVGVLCFTIQLFQTLFNKTLLWKLCCHLCVWSLKSWSVVTDDKTEYSLLQYILTGLAQAEIFMEIAWMCHDQGKAISNNEKQLWEFLKGWERGTFLMARFWSCDASNIFHVDWQWRSIWTTECSDFFPVT